jgi:hypothetical protein
MGYVADCYATRLLLATFLSHGVGVSATCRQCHVCMLCDREKRRGKNESKVSESKENHILHLTIYLDISRITLEWSTNLSEMQFGKVKLL